MEKELSCHEKNHPLTGILLMTLASGCECLYGLTNEITDCQIKCYNRLMAKTSYREMVPACTGMDCPYSFREGFLDGYVSVADGGNGCAPAVPRIPCCNYMWLDCCTENERLETWYDGYEHGVLAAQADGMYGSNLIVSRTAGLLGPMEYPMPPPSGHFESSARPAAVEESPEKAVPPAPRTESEDAKPNQTRRIPSSIFE